MRYIRLWEGFDGLISVIQTHLKDYAETEEKYGNVTDECKKQKLNSVKETIILLERMRGPHGYFIRRFDEVEAKYPKYQYLIVEYMNGDVDSGGGFIVQGNGWAGMTDEKTTGYFEFVNGKLEMTDSPDQCETDRLVNELQEYYTELEAVGTKADTDSDNDFEQLNRLLKENLYSWWD